MKGEPMGCILKCHRCGFEGNHGFSSVVAGIMHFYHLEPDAKQRTCNGFYEVENQVFLELKDAWKAIRKNYPNDAWRKGWDAEIAGNKKKAKKFFREWLTDDNPPALGSSPPQRPSKIVR